MQGIRESKLLPFIFYLKYTSNMTLIALCFIFFEFCNTHHIPPPGMLRDQVTGSDNSSVVYPNYWEQLHNKSLGRCPEPRASYNTQHGSSHLQKCDQISTISIQGKYLHVQRFYKG